MFDLTEKHLLKASLLKLAEQRHLLFFNIHHIIADGWSMGLLLRDWAQYYAQLTIGKGTTLPDLTVQYSDFASWQKNWLCGDILERQMSYWKNQLNHLQILELPMDRPRGNSEHQKQGATIGFSFNKELSEKLNQLAKSQDVSLYMLLVSGFFILLHRYCNEDDVAVGSPVAGRMRTEVEDLIGFL